jgi:hypothetical protein
VDLHAGFKLSQNGEAIGLFAPDGVLVDSVTFDAQTNNISQGRWPDGNASLYFMPMPTPRAANVIPTNPAEIRIVSIALALNGDATITWSSVAGRSYRVEFTGNLNAPAWTPLPEVSAVGAFTSVTDAFSGSAQRFYRVRELAP